MRRNKFSVENFNFSIVTGGKKEKRGIHSRLVVRSNKEGISVVFRFSSRSRNMLGIHTHTIEPVSSLPNEHLIIHHLS